MLTTTDLMNGTFSLQLSGVFAPIQATASGDVTSSASHLAELASESKVSWYHQYMELHRRQPSFKALRRALEDRAVQEQSPSLDSSTMTAPILQ